MRYELFIGLRYIFGRKQEKFISIVTLFSVLGVAVGVAALIATLSVMSGFDNELKTRIIGANPHIFIEKELGISNAESLIKEINQIEGVKGSFPYIWSQGIIEFRGRAQGVALRSIDAKNKIDVSKVKPLLLSRAVNAEIDQGLIIGKELASALGVYISDEVALVTPNSKKPQKIEVTAIYESGMYDYDANIAYVGLDRLSTMLGNKKTVNGIGVDCVLASECVGVKYKILEKIGRHFIVATWMDRNKNLFSAIKLEKLAMFVVLTLIIIVACFSIVGVLVMTVMKKTKDIGILKAIGVSRKGIVAIFSLQGFIIGATGVTLGLLGGLGASYILKEFVKLPKEVYYIDKIPIKFHTVDTIIIVAAALFLSLLATIYPAYQASRLEPVRALRYE